MLRVRAVAQVLAPVEASVRVLAPAHASGAAAADLLSLGARRPWLAILGSLGLDNCVEGLSATKQALGQIRLPPSAEASVTVRVPAVARVPAPAQASAALGLSARCYWLGQDTRVQGLRMPRTETLGGSTSRDRFMKPGNYSHVTWLGGNKAKY